jgi:hypothetical protein
MPSGLLEFDVAGTGTGMFSQLNITGNGTFDGIIDIDFIDGYLTSLGATFDLINALTANFSGATIDILGLPPGFLYSTNFSSGEFELTSLNSPTPEPQSMGLAALGLIVFGALYRRKNAKAKRP